MIVGRRGEDDGRGCGRLPDFLGEDKIRHLGRRDSAGCIRLSPANAKELFFKIRNTTQGRVPALAMNDNGSTDRWGRAQRDQAGSVILQVLYFKATKGKRIFLMSPLHHHFELKGWAEITVVVRFWIIAALFVAAGVGVFYLEWVSR